MNNEFSKPFFFAFTDYILHFQYKMSASFLEIYNETLRDLLSSSSSSGSSSTSHEIKMDPDRPGQVYVTNLTPVPVTSEKQVCCSCRHVTGAM